MNRNYRFIAYAALIAAMYTVLTHLQNLMIPGSATWAIQFRASEALCVLALFTPAAIPGLTVGCFLFNLTYAAALPMDILAGSLATALACGSMYLSRKVKLKGIPVLGMAMPVMFNAVIIGWELSVYIGGGFLVNASYVAAGEAAVMATLGLLLYTAMRKRNLDSRLFGESKH